MIFIDTVHGGQTWQCEIEIQAKRNTFRKNNITLKLNCRKMGFDQTNLGIECFIMTVSIAQF